MLSTGIYPNILKIACVTSLFKSGSPENLNNYRPISSLPILNIIFEKLLYNRLLKFLETNNFFSKSQYGFRKGKKTTDAVVKLLNNVYDSFNKKNYLGAVFIDLSKAFDTVDHHILLQKLENYGIRGIPLMLFKSYLSHRRQFVSLNGVNSPPLQISLGVPQGSVLGPLLFLIYINDLPNALDLLQPVLFADDTTLYFTHSNPYTLCRTISKELKQLHNWLISNRLTLNINKSYYIIFSLRDIPPDINISIANTTLERKSEGKFLGIIIDDKLNFDSHINAVSTNVSKWTGTLYKLKTHIPLNILINLYYAFIYPHLNYGILAWGSTIASHMYPLVILQKRLIRILTNSDYLAHTSPLFKDKSLIKIKDIYSTHCLLYLFEVLKTNKHNTQQYISSIQPSHSHNTRSRNLTMPYPRISKYKHSPLYQSMTLWNSLPENLKTIGTSIQFKVKLKAYFLNQY